jgi:hypothetical protein
VLAAVLLASAMKLLNVPSVATGVIAVSVGIVLLLLPQLLRRTGVPRWARAPQAEEDASRAHLSEV